MSVLIFDWHFRLTVRMPWISLDSDFKTRIYMIFDRRLRMPWISKQRGRIKLRIFVEFSKEFDPISIAENVESFLKRFITGAIVVEKILTHLCIESWPSKTLFQCCFTLWKKFLDQKIFDQLIMFWCLFHASKIDLSCSARGSFSQLLRVVEIVEVSRIFLDSAWQKITRSSDDTSGCL